MLIGFDAKRVFENSTGLGNYSRSLVRGLAELYPQHQYVLFARKKSRLFDVSCCNNISVQLPSKAVDKRFPALWRRSSMVKDIDSSGMDIFHGLSNELPKGIHKCNVKSVVTIHDLIFERFPNTYHFDERYTHRWKMRQACREADRVIAASEQTKADLIDLYQVPSEKIVVCYQNCNPIFEKKVSTQEKLLIQLKYDLPANYFLFVSSITQRKNLLTVCKALLQLKGKVSVPVIVIGNGKKEKASIKKFLESNGLTQQVIFLNDHPGAQELGFITSNDFPAIYQQSLAMIYPSYYEGFGIPILEAMWSGLPVISSNTSSLPEVAGDAALYFSPTDIDTLAQHILTITADSDLAESLRQKGFKQAAKFTKEKHAAAVMNVYNDLLKG